MPQPFVSEPVNPQCDHTPSFFSNTPSFATKVIGDICFCTAHMGLSSTNAVLLIKCGPFQCRNGKQAHLKKFFLLIYIFQKIMNSMYFILSSETFEDLGWVQWQTSKWNSIWKGVLCACCKTWERALLFSFPPFIQTFVLLLDKILINRKLKKNVVQLFWMLFFGFLGHATPSYSKQSL